MATRGAGLLAGLLLLACPALAQSPALNVLGTVAAIDADTIAVRNAEGVSSGSPPHRPSS